jgi:hypothetical protein
MLPTPLAYIGMVNLFVCGRYGVLQPLQHPTDLFALPRNTGVYNVTGGATQLVCVAVVLR